MLLASARLQLQAVGKQGLGIQIMLYTDIYSLVLGDGYPHTEPAHPSHCDTKYEHPSPDVALDYRIASITNCGCVHCRDALMTTGYADGCAYLV